jgi:hypothetical protein
LSGLKSELLCELHCSSKCLLLLLVVFLAVNSLELQVERFLATCAINTPINEWDVRLTKNNEGVHSLGWVGQEEESWGKFRIVVREY